MRRRRAARHPAHGVHRSLDLIDAALPLTQPAGLEPVGRRPSARLASAGFVFSKQAAQREYGRDPIAA